jgi:hypothetical protein
MIWNFDTIEEQLKPEYSLIPMGTKAKVFMTIEPGGYNNPERGWTGGFATRNPDSGSVYLKLKFVVVEGEYARRNIWGMLGLHSEKGPKWGEMGKDFAKSIMCSVHGVGLFDKSSHARNACKVNSFADLDGVEFLALIDVEVRDGKERNVIKRALTIDDEDYSASIASKASLGQPSAIKASANKAPVNQVPATQVPATQVPVTQVPASTPMQSVVGSDALLEDALPEWNNNF